MAHIKQCHSPACPEYSQHIDHVNLAHVLGCALQKAEIAGIASAVFKTTDLHSSEFLPVGTAYVEAEKLKKSLAK